MSSITYLNACVAFGAWLGSMFERHARGLRPIASIANEAAVERQARSFGVAWPASIDFGFHASEQWRRWLPRHEAAIDHLVLRVATTARGWRHEDRFITTLLAYSPCTLPSAIVNDIIDRNLPTSIQLLSHSNLDDPELWRLVDHVPEAGQTLALRRYCDPNEGVDRLSEVFTQLRWPDLAAWLASQHYTPSSTEKAELVAARIIDDAAAARQPVRVLRKWHPMVTQAITRIRP